MMIDSPTYMFNSQTGQLSYSYVNFEINQDIKAIVGEGVALKGQAGGGMSSGLTGVYTTPAKTGSTILTRLDNDGTARITYNDKIIILKVNESWSDTTSYIQTYKTGKLKMIQIEQIVNYGYQPKPGIKHL